MEKKKDKYKLNQLTEFDTVEYRNAVQQLDKLIEEGTVTESSIKVLNNIINMLTIIRDKHINLLISWLKQDYILDDEN